MPQRRLELEDRYKQENAANVDKLAMNMKNILKKYPIQELRDACVKNGNEIEQSIRKDVRAVRNWIGVHMYYLVGKDNEYGRYWWRRFFYRVDMMRRDHPRKMMVLMQCTFPQEVMEVVSSYDRNSWWKTLLSRWEWGRDLVSKRSALKNLRQTLVNNAADHTKRKISVRRHPLQQPMVQKVNDYSKSEIFSHLP